MARQTLDVLDATEGPIIVPSGSCAAMIIHHAPELVAADTQYTARAQRVAGRTRELTQFLVDDADVDLDEMDCGDCVATYHASCHGLRWLQVLEQPKQLLADAGVQRVDMAGEDECCGFGGLFSIKMPEVSTAMMDTKIANIEASGADVVVGVDVSCLMHIGGGLKRRGSNVAAKHIAEVLAGEQP
jgi:L-lactate dehydrogenase complex protein LldE